MLPCVSAALLYYHHWNRPLQRHLDLDFGAGFIRAEVVAANGDQQVEFANEPLAYSGVILAFDYYSRRGATESAATTPAPSAIYLPGRASL